MILGNVYLSVKKFTVEFQIHFQPNYHKSEIDSSIHSASNANMSFHLQYMASFILKIMLLQREWRVFRTSEVTQASNTSGVHAILSNLVHALLPATFQKEFRFIIENYSSFPHLNHITMYFNVLHFILPYIYPYRPQSALHHDSIFRAFENNWTQ